MTCGGWALVPLLLLLLLLGAGAGAALVPATLEPAVLAREGVVRLLDDGGMDVVAVTVCPRLRSATVAAVAQVLATQTQAGSPQLGTDAPLALAALALRAALPCWSVAGAALPVCRAGVVADCAFPEAEYELAGQLSLNGSAAGLLRVPKLAPELVPQLVPVPTSDGAERLAVAAWPPGGNYSSLGLELRYEQLGNGALMEQLKDSLAATPRLLQQRARVETLDPAATNVSFCVSTDYLATSGSSRALDGRGCLAPYTVFQVVWTVNADSYAGRSSALLLTDVVRPLQPPPNLRVRLPNSDAMRLQFDEPPVSPGPIDIFSGLVQDLDYGGPNISAVGRRGVSLGYICTAGTCVYVFNINPLAPYRRYRAWFAMGTVRGLGPLTPDGIEFKTLEDVGAVPGVPNVTLTAANDFVISWAPPAVLTGEPVSYEVVAGADPARGVDGVSLGIVPAAGPLELRVPLSRNFSQQDATNVRVRSSTAVGFGALSERGDYVPEAAPSSSTSGSDTPLVAALVSVLVVMLLVLAAVLLVCRPCDRRVVPPGVNRWELPERDVQLRRLLGAGSHGQVHEGLLLRAHNNTPAQTLVAVKVLDPDASGESWRQLMTEIVTMEKIAAVRHRNVLSLIGFCRGANPKLVTEFATNGDLHTLVQVLGRQTDDLLPDQLCNLLVHFSADIACGMTFLHQNDIVHRDLACRNCLLMPDLTVKIADYGLSRSLSWCTRIINDPDRETDQDVDVSFLPIRWTDPDAIIFKKFSTSTGWLLGE